MKKLILVFISLGLILFASMSSWAWEDYDWGSYPFNWENSSYNWKTLPTTGRILPITGEETTLFMTKEVIPGDTLHLKLVEASIFLITLGGNRAGLI